MHYTASYRSSVIRAEEVRPEVVRTSGSAEYEEKAVATTGIWNGDCLQSRHSYVKRKGHTILDRFELQIIVQIIHCSNSENV